MPNVCPECGGGPLEVVLVLPGGREVPERDAPFGDGPRGVERAERCRGCGTRFDPDSPDTTEHRDGGG